MGLVGPSVRALVQCALGRGPVWGGGQPQLVRVPCQASQSLIPGARTASVKGCCLNTASPHGSGCCEPFGCVRW